MSRRTHSILAVFGMAALLGGVLAGCATSPGGDGTGVELDAAWLDDGRMIGLITMGSSTCVPYADEPTLDGAVLEVTLIEPEGDTPCTRDLVPRVTLVGVPEGVDPSQDLDIRVSGDGYSGETDLDGVAGLAGPGGITEYAPSAGWADADDTFVILTWGSSSCAPVVESVEATGPAEVTVAFAEFPANQVCTMDMAPRGAVATVSGLEADSNVELILTDSVSDPITVPIYGEN